MSVDLQGEKLKGLGLGFGFSFSFLLPVFKQPKLSERRKLKLMEISNRATILKAPSLPQTPTVHLHV